VTVLVGVIDGVILTDGVTETVGVGVTVGVVVGVGVGVTVGHVEQSLTANTTPDAFI
jgi:hypothetical protein